MKCITLIFFINKRCLCVAIRSKGNELLNFDYSLFGMNRNGLQYAGYILLILGLIGMISGVAPAWSRYTVLILGMIIVLITASRKPGK